MHDSLAPNSKRTAQEMFSLIQEQQAGELPVKAFCELKNLSEARYYYWRKKYMNDGASATEPNTEKFNLLQLEIDEQNNAPLFAEYKGLKLYREVPVSYLKELMN
jgi:hypothetical protein